MNEAMILCTITFFSAKSDSTEEKNYIAYFYFCVFTKKRLGFCLRLDRVLKGKIVCVSN